MARDARGPRVEVEIRIGIELAGLRITNLVDLVAMAQREIASARAMRCFEQDALVALATQLVGCGETRDSRTEDDHALRILSGRCHVGARDRVRVGHQSETQGGLVGGGGTCCRTDQMQQPSS